MFQRIRQWINDRWPLNKLIRIGLDEEIPGGPSFAYVFGSCVLVIFLLQVATGVWQLLYFVPTVDRGCKIEDGILYVQWQEFRVGVSEKIPV